MTTPDDQTPLHRLQKRTEFLRVQRQGTRWAAPGLVLQARAWRQTDPDKYRQSGGIGVGFTTSKKVGNAVMRNRARRRLRAAVDEVFPSLAAPEHDFVVIGRQATVTRPWKKLCEDLKQALKRLETYRKTPVQISEGPSTGGED